MPGVKRENRGCTHRAVETAGYNSTKSASADWLSSPRRGTLCLCSRDFSRLAVKSPRQGMMLVALTIVLLIFAVTTAGLLAVTSEHVGASASHRRAVALALAEAGLAQAAHRLASDPAYSSGRGRLETGTFQVRVSAGPDASRRIVTSTGMAEGVAPKVRKSVEAELDISSPGALRLVYWREL